MYLLPTDFLNIIKSLKLDEYYNIELSLVEAIINSASEFGNKTLLPINYKLDQEKIILDKSVLLSKDHKVAYKKFIEAGWNNISGDDKYGGQNLPEFLYFIISDIFNSCNMAFSLCPLLTNGAIELITKHGTEKQKQDYLPNLIKGSWTGTMCLTEPSAGSDLSKITTKAIKKDGKYYIKGQKIFITYGDHDLSDNIIHMVLAKIEGQKEISLFIVPKFIEKKANDITPISVEHKLGIHASPTLTLSFGENEGAEAYLIGEETQGLKQMFTMMNNARLAVGVQAIGIAEIAYQKALEYSKERMQGKVDNQEVTIFNHPIINKKLKFIKSYLFALRSLYIYSSNSKLKEFFIPIIKAHSTNISLDIISESVQIFGGMGYIEETGIAQQFRDVKITQIYEGTNEIQALDLVNRKLKYLDDFIKELNNYDINCQNLKQIKETKLEENADIVLEILGIYSCALMHKIIKNEHSEFFFKFIFPKTNYLISIL